MSSNNNHYIEEKIQQDNSQSNYDDGEFGNEPILIHTPNTYPEVDGYFLKNINNKSKNITKAKIEVLEKLMENAVKLMISKAESGYTQCRYPIPDIIAGYPVVDQKFSVIQLKESLSKRPGIKVEMEYQKDSENYFLNISW
jgi:hypothetical protein